MKSIAVLAFAAGVSAQVASYNSIGDAIDAQVKSLDALVKAYTGGPGTAVIGQASKLLSAVNSGAAAIPKLSSFTDLNDALSLLSTYTPLASDIQTVVRDLDGKKSLIDQQAGLCQSASSLLVAESSAAVKLANAVVAQLQDPRVAGAPAIASTSVIDPITSALSSGVATFSSCPAASASGSSSVAPKTSSSSSKGGATTSKASSSNATPTASVIGSTTSRAASTGSTCTSTGYNSKQVKKCLKIISSAALGQCGGSGYGEL